MSEYDHLKQWDDEFREVLRAWRHVSTFWRIVLSNFPRKHWKSFLYAFGWATPGVRDRNFWFLERMIFDSPCYMIRYGHGKWEDVQKYLRHCVLFER